MNDPQQLIPEGPASRLTGGTRISAGNQVRYLKDAAENFPAWLQGIQNAHPVSYTHLTLPTKA